MTTTWIVLISLVTLASPGGAAGSPKHSPAVACAKDALTSHEKHEQGALMTDVLLPAVEEVRPLASGYAFRLPARSDLLVKVAEWVTAERKCCSYLTFVLRVEGGEDAIWLELTGPEGAKEVLSDSYLSLLAARRVTGTTTR